MKKTLLVISVALALVFPTFAQDKEQDRVENAGKVMQEILDAPDSIPKSVLDKGRLRRHSAVGPEVLLSAWAAATAAA